MRCVVNCEYTWRDGDTEPHAFAWRAGLPCSSLCYYYEIRRRRLDPLTYLAIVVVCALCIDANGLVCVIHTLDFASLFATHTVRVTFSIWCIWYILWLVITN